MTQEDKELLLKDLCARLPYGVKVDINFYDNTKELNCSLLQDYIVSEKSLRPYLRPMSSMSDEEKKEIYNQYVFAIHANEIRISYHSEGYWDDDTECSSTEYFKLLDWLNVRHFDYRGLIEMGLALVAPEDMYKKINYERY